MSKGKDLFARISSYLDLPPEALPGGFSLLLSGERELCVRGRAIICSYHDKRIVISVGKHMLCVRGESLFCAELSSEKMLISGTITGIFFLTEGEDAT